MITDDDFKGLLRLKTAILSDKATRAGHGVANETYTDAEAAARHAGDSRLALVNTIVRQNATIDEKNKLIDDLTAKLSKPSNRETFLEFINDELHKAVKLENKKVLDYHKLIKKYGGLCRHFLPRDVKCIMDELKKSEPMNLQDDVEAFPEKSKLIKQNRMLAKTVWNESAEALAAEVLAADAKEEKSKWEKEIDSLIDHNHIFFAI